MGFKGSQFLLNLDFKIMGSEGQADKFEETVSLTVEVDRPAWSAPRFNRRKLRGCSRAIAIDSWCRRAVAKLSCHYARRDCSQFAATAN